MAEKSGFSDQPSWFSRFLFYHNRPLDKGCKSNFSVLCYGACAGVAEEFRTSFKQNKHDTESCEIRICSRWSKCNTSWPWWRPWLYTKKYWHSPSTAHSFADSSLGPTQLRRFSIVFVWGDDYSYWPAKLFHLFFVKSDGVAEKEEELAFVQYFKVTPSNDEIDGELHSFSLRWAPDDEIDDCTFRPRYSGIMDAGECYGAVQFSSIISARHIVRANYSVTPFYADIRWSAHRFYVFRSH